MFINYFSKNSSTFFFVLLNIKVVQHIVIRSNDFLIISHDIDIEFVNGIFLKVKN